MAQYSFTGDAAVVSKYIWRGQRLTNDWSLQPSMTLGVGDFSFNTWATMDLTAVNPADNICIPECFTTPPGDDDQGLKGQFSEVDYTFSYGYAFDQVSVEGGTIFYTFPQRSSFLASTTEIYGSATFDTVPGAPSATLYVDVDETNASDGTTGIYFLISAGHSLETGNDIFPGVDFSGSISFVNSGFSDFYYGADPSESGAHDASFTVNAPIEIGNGLSAGAFLTYSALLRGFRQYQYPDPRVDIAGDPWTPGSLADTVWGGFTLSLSFDN